MPRPKGRSNSETDNQGTTAPSGPAAGIPPANLRKLSKVAIQPDRVVEGGVDELDIYMRDEKDPERLFTPLMSLWLDGPTGMVLSFAIVDPDGSSNGGVSESLAALVEGIVKPMPLPLTQAAGGKRAVPEGLPSIVRVNDEALANAARDLFASLDLAVRVEHVDELENFDEALDELMEFLGYDENEGPPEPFAWDIDESALPALYGAAASYWRRAPWEYLGSDLPLSVQLGEHGPKPGVDTLYPVVLGNAGEVFGLAIYYSLGAFRRFAGAGEKMLAQDIDEEALLAQMRQLGLPVDQLPEPVLQQMFTELRQQMGLAETGSQALFDTDEDTMVVFFDAVDEVDPTYVRWLREHTLKYASRDAVPEFFVFEPGGKPREPKLREVQALTLTLEALDQFFKARRAQLEALFPPDLEQLPELEPGAVEFAAQVGEGKGKAGKLAVEVSLPAKGF